MFGVSNAKFLAFDTFDENAMILVQTSELRNEQRSKRDREEEREERKRVKKNI